MSHSLPVRPPLRPWLARKLGPGGFAMAYPALSVGALAWVVAAAGRAPVMALWPRAAWRNWVKQGAILAACLLLAVAFVPNPPSFGGWRNVRFDPARPGPVGWMRHPVLAALALWSVGHLAPNGEIAHAAMFGGVAGFAVLGIAMIDRRRRREMGAARWAQMAGGRGSLPSRLFLRLGCGFALWAGLAWLHPAVIGAVAVWWW